MTWFTFLPSFLFILTGGPLLEGTHGNLKFTAPLTTIALFRYKRNVIHVIAACALLGLLIKLF